jgi:hypothetical protein
MPAKTVTEYCAICGQTVFKGHVVKYPHGENDVETDVNGAYVDGGKCRECGRLLCGGCGAFAGGVCAECREGETDRYGDDDFPF